MYLHLLPHFLISIVVFDLKYLIIFHKLEKTDIDFETGISKNVIMK